MKREELDFGEDLVQRGSITQEELDRAILSGGDKKQNLRNSLLGLGLLTPEAYELARADYYGIPYMSLVHYLTDPQLLMQVTEEFARNQMVFPLFASEDRIAVAVSDPTNLITLDRLVAEVGKEIDLYYSPENSILEAIDRNFSLHLFSALKDSDAGVSADAYDVPRLVDTLIQRAVRDGASDIHIEPGRDHVLVRQRVDGVLVEVNTLPTEIQTNVISRVKIMAGLDISETRTPQDGHISITVSGEDVALRISTLPTLNGENLVIRILIASQTRISLEALGLSKLSLDRVDKMVSRPYGMIIVTGPTGSGKTTTLYSILERLNTVAKNIMTIEDPVEYTIDLLRQIEVNHKVGLNFSTGLRAILRQDPDIVMVGEIRDGETARVAVQAALTGHLVLSTMHTNDAAGALTRLTQMGVQPFLVASSLVGVIGQRLVRLVCPGCRETYEPEENLKKLVPVEDMTWYRPVGCDRCRNSGYKGRTAIHEVLTMTPELMALVTKRASTDRYRQLAMQQGMRTMFEDGTEKVADGLSTLEEIMSTCEALTSLDVDEVPA